MPSWDTLYARRLEWMTTSLIREILKVAQSPDIISLAGGWPEAALFPVEELQTICHDVLAEMPRESLQYGLTDGYVGLRQVLAEHMTDLGMPASEGNIVITSGSQQALDLMGRIFIDEGDAVIVESPTFIGALQSFRAYGARFLAAPLDEEGIALEPLRDLLAQEQPKFMYLLPTFQNPTGVTMSLERRQAVVALAREAGVPILEDDPYGLLRYSGEHLPTLASLDMASSGIEDSNVVYLSTFSKLLAPGLRLAWALCPKDVAEQFVMAKQGADLHTNGLSQTIAYAFMREGRLPAQVERIKAVYRERRDAMCEAIRRYFPTDVQYTRPEGGLFLWVTLPESFDALPLLEEAAERKVAFVPGSPFHPDGSGANTMRLSFACVPPARIEEAIKRLGELIAAHLEE